MSRIARRVRQPGVYFITTDTWQRREVFRNPDPARMVVEQITECQERKFYRLHAFVLMPNHLHMLITPSEEASIEKAVMMIKGGSSHRIKKELLYTSPIWMPGYHDRWIRKQYIEQNPVKARLSESPADYQWSSASGKFKVARCFYDEES
jgi:REP-associated tyrosine transposase